MDKPTVTQLLDILNKPALMTWANKIGLKGIRLDEYRSKCLKQGTSLHNQIQRYLEHKEPFEDMKVQKGFEVFLQDKDILEIEKNIETNHFIGRYDMKYKHGKLVYLVDFKSSKGVYVENVLQLIAYNMKERADRIAIVEVPSFQVKVINVNNAESFQEMLVCLSRIYYIKKELSWNINGGNRR